MSVSVTLGRAGRIIGIGSVGLSFPSGARSWQLRLAIGGIVVSTRSGSAFNDAPVVSGDRAVAAGTHTLTVDFAMDTPGSFTGGNLIGLGAMR